ncbi:hypothetical protein [Haloquadratum walsbyi]|nr:hypothetical protein [Haloquadratum walsbyi]
MLFRERAYINTIVGQVDTVVEFVVSHPALIVLLAMLLGFTFFSYLFIRRILTGLREGYDESYRES